MKSISKILLLTFISTTLHLNTFSQDELCNELQNKKNYKEYKKAESLLSLKMYNDAEKILLKILSEETEFAEAWAALAEINYVKSESAANQKQKDSYFAKYIENLKKIIEICPSFQNYELYFVLGKYEQSIKNISKAKDYFNKYISKSSPKSPYYSNAKKTLDEMEEYQKLISNKVPFEPILLVNVSTDDDEYLPLISPDGSLLFYTHAYMKKNISSSVTSAAGGFVEEFTVSNALDNNSGINFSKGSAMPFPFNTGRNQGASTITIDNNKLFITLCEYVSRDYNNCDIYYSVRTSKGWSELKNMGANINGLHTWESQPSISTDGKVLYFASIREGNVGFDINNPTSDIYYSVLNDNGTWSKAKNIGTTINTSGNEKSPFIHSDSHTLYFSSDGHYGIGGYDIFYSKYRNAEWTKPVNIGYPINTENDDISFIVNTQGTKAYFASNKLAEKGGWSIYAMDLYEEARPEKVFLVKGQLIDDNGKTITDAKIEIKNADNEKIAESIVNNETGNYAVAVNAEKKEDENYLMIVKKDGYNFTSALIEPTAETFESPKVVNFEIKEIEKGKSVELNDLYFATASYTIDKKSFNMLNNFAEFLQENPTIIIELRGHTDNTGNLQANITLSNQRAKAVYDYLISKGIASNRLKYQGFGPNMPIANNDTEDGKAKNRRTEFFIISK